MIDPRSTRAVPAHARASRRRRDTRGRWVRLAVADTGLGLAVAHGIVAAQGGAIEVSSRPGDRTRFDIFLPGAA